MSLLELAVVVSIVGLLGVMAATRYGSSTLSNVDAQGFARRIALDCSYARRLAIATGDNHLLRFSFSGSSASQYALYRRQGSSTTVVDEIHLVPAGLIVTTGGATDLEFTFVGEALGSYTVSVQAPDRTCTVLVPQVTGKPFVQ
jgi:hypothetical protein